MPTPTKGHRLGGGPAHERHVLANLATALFQRGQITTTEAKAKRLRPVAERLITFAKRGDLHARRRVLTVVTDKGVVDQLFTEIAPEFSERDGGYTRITKIGPRKGDNAAMAVIELVHGEPVAARPRRRARRPGPGRRAPAGTATAVAEAEPDEAARSRPPRSRTARSKTSATRRRPRTTPKPATRAQPAGRLTRIAPRWTRGDPGPFGSGLIFPTTVTAFSGWAAQPGRRTVEDVLAAALGRALRLPPAELTVAGRTDAGCTPAARSSTRTSPPPPGPARRPAVARLAGVLPADVRVRAAGPAPDGSTRDSPRCGGATPTASATTRPPRTRCAGTRRCGTSGGSTWPP